MASDDCRAGELSNDGNTATVNVAESLRDLESRSTDENLTAEIHAFVRQWITDTVPGFPVEALHTPRWSRQSDVARKDVSIQLEMARRNRSN